MKIEKGTLVVTEVLVPASELHAVKAQLAVAHKTIETLRAQLKRKIEAQKHWRKK